MKRLFLSLLIMLITCVILTPAIVNAKTSKNTTLSIEGKEIKKIETPFIEKGSKYFPAKDIYSEFGFKLVEIKKGKKIKLVRGDIVITLSTNDTLATVNEKKVYGGKLIYRNSNYYVSFYVNQNILKYVFDWDKVNKKVNIVITDDYSPDTPDTIKKAQEILSQIITPNMNELEKEYAIYDYITHNVTYNIDHGRAYDALVLKKARCQGISSALDLLLKLAGFECDIIDGGAGSPSQPHSWNVVKVNGKYYFLDATWGLAEGQTYNYNYFNMTTAEIEKDHYANELVMDRYETFLRTLENIPVCKDKTFSNMRSVLSNCILRENNWLYYSKDGKLYKCRIDGKEETILQAEGVYNQDLWMSDDGFIYRSVNDRLVYVKKDGTQFTIIRENVYKAYRAQDYIYYEIYDEDNSKRGIYICNMDGSNDQLVSDYSYLCWVNTFKAPYIIYSNDQNEDNINIIAYDIRNKESKIIYTGVISDWTFKDGYVYIGVMNKIYKISSDGKTKEILIEERDKENQEIFIYNMWIDDSNLNYTIRINEEEKEYYFDFNTDKKYSGSSFEN